MRRGKSKRPVNTFDAPWKAMLECYLEPFLRLGFPRVNRLVDWRLKPVFLEKELQQLASDLPQGNVTADKLVKVRLKDGTDQYLHIHIEVQAQRDPLFARRMWTYHYRVYDRVRGSLVSLAVLADGSRNWRPGEYREELAGCERYFRFPIFKVLDCKESEAVFKRTGNPFALVVAAQQVALRTIHRPERRLEERLRLVRYLVEHGLARMEAVNLLRLIRWLTRLPEDLELKFQEDMARLEENSNMKTIDTLLLPWEERALKKGRREGHVDGVRTALLELLEFRFHHVPAELRARLNALN